MKHEFENSRVYLEDCMVGMAKYPDNHFDLAVVDPPYGINWASKKTSITRRTDRAKGVIVAHPHAIKEWDKATPNADYFKELGRISKEQIIWGGNYFADILEPTNSWIIWNKLQKLETRSDGEMAWSSLTHPVKIVPLLYSGFRRAVSVGYNKPIEYNKPFSGKQNIHPTQKPVALYDWIFKNYAKEGDKILDTHLGSQSSRISAYKNGLDFTGYELDEDYFRDGNKRFTDFTNQLVLL